MLVVWLLTAGHAAPPDALAQLLDINTTTGGQVERMKVSPAGDVVAGRTQGNTGGWLYDLDSWELRTFAPCDVTGVAPIDFGIPPQPQTTEIWVSCADGRVEAVVWNGEGIEDLSVSLDVDDSLSDIWFDEASDLLYALSVAGAGNAVVHVVDPFDLELDAVDSSVSKYFPKLLAFKGYQEGTVVRGSLVVSHGARGMSSLVLGNNASSVVSAVAAASECDDMAPTPQGTVYCVDRTLDIVSEYPVPLTGSSNVLGLGALDGPEAVGVSLDPSDGWLAVTGNQVNVWAISGGSIQSPPVFQGPPDADNPINDIVTYQGYLFGGGPEGRLHVVTARPWVYPRSVELRLGPDPILPGQRLEAGEVVTLVFQVDEAGSYRVYLGGDRHAQGGIALASGEMQADTDVEVDFTVDAQFEEGNNPLYIIAENDRNLLGHARALLDVDNPPHAPTLRNDNVQFGDGRLILDFDGIPDEDLDHYDIYVVASEWAGADWPEGGPVYDGTTSLTTPIKAKAAGGDHQTVTIRPLENAVTYYIGVRATDAGGKEGPMSAIVSGTPRQTFTAAGLAGDTGGAPCATGVGPASIWFVMLSGLLALSRRERAGAWLALVLAVALGVPSVSSAQDDQKSTPPWLRQDMTPSRGDFEIRYGVINLDDTRITQIYDQSPTNLLHAEFGPQFFRVAEIDFGFGFFQELAKTIDAEGNVSGDKTMLTWWPLSVDATARLHILDEQPLVPFVRYGFDYIIWSERSDDGTGGKDIVRGAKFGNHTGFGVNLLLDIFQPRRASLLEARSGINDSWLTFEWRRQRVDGRTLPWQSGAGTGGLDFSGNAFTVGLKLDY